MPHAEDRAQALHDIATLANRHGLSLQDIADAMGNGATAHDGSRARGLLVRVLGYVGGTFVFAGVCVFIALQWDTMTSAGRVVITLGSGVAAFILAVLAQRDARFEKATTALFLIATALEPTGLFVLFDEYGAGGDWRWAVLIVCGTMAAQFGAVFVPLARSTLLLVSVAFAVFFAWTAFDLLDVDGEVIALVVGTSLVLSATGVDRTRHRTITPAWYLVGATAALAGLFELVERSPIELVFLLTAAGVVYLSVAVRSRTLLLVATLAILAYTGWFTNEHFADSVGWPIALVAFGLFLIGLSAMALRIDRTYLRSGSPASSPRSRVRSSGEPNDPPMSDTSAR